MVLAGAGDNGTDAVAAEEKTVILSPGNWNTTYGAHGAVAGDWRWTYSWNSLGRLSGMVTKPAAVSAGMPNIRLKFAYDDQGRRITKKAEYLTGGGNTVERTVNTRFVYDGWRLLAEETTDSAGGAPTMRYYTWGKDISGSLEGTGGVGGLLAIHEAGVSYCPIYDGNGNVIALVNASTGAEVAAWSRGPFGELISERGDTRLCPFGFATHYTDGESGLVYFGMRYYSPQSGRWMSREPLGETESFNLYAYCYNDPVNGVDILGLSWSPLTLKYWSEGGAANMLWAKNKYYDWIESLGKPPEGPCILTEISNTSSRQIKKNIFGGVRDGTGNAILAIPDACIALQSGMETFTKRAIGSHDGIPDSVLESMDLRSHNVKIASNYLSELHEANTELATSNGANANSQLFQLSSETTTAVVLSLAPELRGAKWPTSFKWQREIRLSYVAETGGRAQGVLTPGGMRTITGAQQLEFDFTGRTVFSGHGMYRPSLGTTVIPEGTSLTVYSDVGEAISQRLGNAIELNADLRGVYSRTLQAGEVVPDLSLLPADFMVFGNATTVTKETPLSLLLKPNMGDTFWGACQRIDFD